MADGIDMIVSTDHNAVTDYAPSIRQLGLGSLITTAVGDELTTNGWGHYGAFPLPQDMARAGQGAVLVHGHNAKEIFANVRQHAPEAVIDVHHPGIGYFILGEFDPHSDRAGRPGFSFDFDAIEVLNGYQDPARKSVDRMIDDWLGLLNHGHIVTATGNSDTHHLTYNMGGYPRNYVRVRDDRPDHVTPQEVATAVKEHHAFFTTGPFVRFRSGKSDIGDLVPVKGGKATLDIEMPRHGSRSVALFSMCRARRPGGGRCPQARTSYGFASATKSTCPAMVTPSCASTATRSWRRWSATIAPSVSTPSP